MTRRLLLATLLAALLLAGCTASNDTSGQSAGTSGGGSFTKGGNHGAATTTETTTWRNEGATATGSFFVNQASGSITLAVQDSGGATVWTWTGTRVGQSSEGFTTTTGSPGQWTLTVTLVGFTGQYQVEGRSA